MTSQQTQDLIRVLSDIKNILNNPIPNYISIITSVLTLVGIVFTYISVQSSKKAVSEMVASRNNEVRPVIEFGMFQENPNTGEINVRFRCLGKSAVFNLKVFSSKEKVILEVPFLNLGDDLNEYHISASDINKGEIKLEYENIFGYKYRSLGKVEKNNLLGRLRQDILD